MMVVYLNSANVNQIYISDDSPTLLISLRWLVITLLKLIKHRFLISCAHHAHGIIFIGYAQSHMNGKPKLTVFGSMKNKDPKRDIQNQIILSMPISFWRTTIMFNFYIVDYEVFYLLPVYKCFGTTCFIRYINYWNLHFLNICNRKLRFISP
jgi:hypothetical protein